MTCSVIFNQEVQFQIIFHRHNTKPPLQYSDNLPLLLIFKTDLTIEGIYRISGQTSEVVELKEKYDDGKRSTVNVHYVVHKIGFDVDRFIGF